MKLKHQKFNSILQGLPDGHVGILVGDGGVGKSTFALQVGIEIASGTKKKINGFSQPRKF